METRTEKEQNSVKNIPGVVFRYLLYPDGSDRLHYVSEGASEIWGLTAEQVMQDNQLVWDLFHEDDVREHKESLRTSAENLTPWTHEWRIRHPDGSIRWNRGSGNPIMLDSGVIAWDSLIMDITPEKKARIKLAETEQRLRNIIEHSTNLFYSHDREGVFTYLSPQSREFLGYEQEEATLHWTDFVTEHPLNAEGVASTKKAIETGNVQPPYELQLKKADGELIWVEVKEAPILQHGRTVEITGSLTDITDRKIAQEHSEQNRKLLGELADQAWASVWVRDDEGRHFFVNHEFKLLFGLEDQIVTDKTIDDLFDSELARQFKMNDLNVLNSGKSNVFEEWVMTSGGERYYRTNIFPLRKIPGLENLVGGVSIDITDQHLNQEIIRNSLKEKETLLAEIHHRVKNNLAVVSGLMKIQAMNSEDTELHEQLLKATLRIKSMAMIHEQMYESESYSNVQFTGFIRELINNVIKTIQTRTMISLTYELEDVELSINQGIPCSLLINEVMTNILKHGYEGRKAGTITIRLSQQNSTVTLQIEDDGNGFPADFDKIGHQLMGLKLVELLTKQLHGSNSFSTSASGTVFALTFSKADKKGIGSSFIR